MMRRMAFDPDRLLLSAPLEATAFCVAYSGGGDSTALLAALSRLKLPALRAIHVHHGLQAIADDWVLHCERRCEQLGIPLQVVRVSIEPDDALGLEAAAREARHQALMQTLQPGEVLVMAHHRDDQAETFLMRALRGSGVRGLGSMRTLRTFGAGWLWRPLLDVRRSELLDWVAAQGLDWVDDPHNAELRYERVRLRREVLPLLQERWPAATESLAQSARLCAEADDLLDELAGLDAASVIDSQGLSLRGLAALSPARRNNLLRWHFEQQGLPPAPQTALARLPELLEAPADAEPLLSWPGVELRRYREHLQVMRALLPEPEGFEVQWDGVGVLNLPPGCGELRASARRQFTVRFASGGERFRPVAGQASRSLKNLFQERGIPPWKRRRTPLVFEGGELVWVGGLPWQPAEVRIEWSHP